MSAPDPQHRNDERPRLVPRLTLISLALGLPVLAGTSDLILALSALGITVLAVLIMVVWPAIWSKKKTRRDAALAVLGLVLGKPVARRGRPASRR